jgi:hypothetical protein
MTLPTPYPVARYRFDCKVETPIRLPEYAGSTLRGAFGNALRRTACLTREKDCKPCPLYRGCPYPAVFAPPPPAEHGLQKFSEIPVPFIVEPPDWGERHYGTGETLSFHFVLVGHAHAQLPLIIHAWQRALEHGIGKGDGAARLARVCLIGESAEHTVFDAQEGRLQPHTPGMTPPGPDVEPGQIRLRFATPLRLQNNGRPLRPEALDSRTLLVALVRRIALISEFHTGQRLDLDFSALAEASAAIVSEKDLAWRDWTRYSSRQKQEMTLGGVVGGWTLSGKLRPFLPLLHLGQWLHIGKNASFGLGRYHVEHG